MDKHEYRKNKPQREQWYQDLAIGMYVYWTVDAQLGMVNAHSVIGASSDYLHRYFNDLPKTFNPKHFDAEYYARLAKSTGFDYVTIVAKNHNGFCNYNTKTTPFNVVNTPYGKDIVGDFVDALRAYQLPIGMYFSPDDAWFQYKSGNQISRIRKEANPAHNADLLKYDITQIDELMNLYGPIDIMCIDGSPGIGSKALIAQHVWHKDPDTVITRGGMPTPEQELTDEHGPFEAHFTIGNQWQYKGSNNSLKSTTEIIELLLRVRSLGGTLLLAIGGPNPEGEMPEDLSGRLHDLGIWMFVNSEAVKNVRPWHVAQEKNVYFTKAKESDTVYASVTGSPWKWGRRNEITLHGVRATHKTEIEILGQSGEVLEYTHDTPSATWTQHERGLHIQAVRAQRLYNDLKWPHPIVLRITHAQAVEP